MIGYHGIVLEFIHFFEPYVGAIDASREDVGEHREDTICIGSPHADVQ